MLCTSTSLLFAIFISQQVRESLAYCPTIFVGIAPCICVHLMARDVLKIPTKQMQPISVCLHVLSVKYISTLPVPRPLWESLRVELTLWTCGSSACHSTTAGPARCQRPRWSRMVARCWRISQARQTGPLCSGHSEGSGHQLHSWRPGRHCRWSAWPWRRGHGSGKGLWRTCRCRRWRERRMEREVFIPFTINATATICGCWVCIWCFLKNPTYQCKKAHLKHTVMEVKVSLDVVSLTCAVLVSRGKVNTLPDRSRQARDGVSHSFYCLFQAQTLNLVDVSVFSILNP